MQFGGYRVPFLCVGIAVFVIVVPCTLLVRNMREQLRCILNLQLVGCNNICMLHRIQAKTEVAMVIECLSKLCYAYVCVLMSY